MGFWLGFFSFWFEFFCLFVVFLFGYFLFWVFLGGNLVVAVLVSWWLLWSGVFLCVCFLLVLGFQHYFFLDVI